MSASPRVTAALEFCARLQRLLVDGVHTGADGAWQRGVFPLDFAPVVEIGAVGMGMALSKRRVARRVRITRTDQENGNAEVRVLVSEIGAAPQGGMKQ